jgi:hypothetical protein
MKATHYYFFMFLFAMMVQGGLFAGQTQPRGRYVYFHEQGGYIFAQAHDALGLNSLLKSKPQGHRMLH